MSRLTLTLFGSLAITLDGQPVTHLESDKVRGLLARLALEGRRAAAQGRGDRAAAWQALEQAEALLRTSENGFRAARALCRRAELLLWEGQTAQAAALFAATRRHPACAAHIRARAATERV